MKNVAIIILTSIEHIFYIHIRRERNGLRSRIFSTKHLLLFISSLCWTTASSKSGCIIQKHVCKSHESMIDSAQVRFDTKMIYSLNVRRKLRYWWISITQQASGGIFGPFSMPTNRWGLIMTSRLIKVCWTRTKDNIA